MPALLAAILAHLKRVEVLKAALTVLRNIVSDSQAAQRLSGQGAYRIIFAVLQTHCTPSQLDLVRLGSIVLWKMHHCRHPPDAMLHSQLSFSAGGVEQAEAEEAGGPKDSDSDSEDDGAGARGGKPKDAAQSDSALPIPSSSGFKFGGHADFVDLPPPEDEPIDDPPAGPSHAELVVRSIVAEAERLLTAGAHSAQSKVADPASDSHATPRVVYEAHPVDGCEGPAAASLPADALHFDAQFESGNLRRAVQVAPFAYDLVLNCDVNTRGHTQWFFFRVRNMVPAIPTLPPSITSPLPTRSVPPPSLPTLPDPTHTRPRQPILILKRFSKKTI